MKVIVKSLVETRRVAQKFAKELKTKRRAIVLMYANMGAGKTTFVAEVVRNLAKGTRISSPTFTIINQYTSNIFHMDLHRIRDISELRNTDFFEIISGDNIVFIEWAERLGNMKIDNAIKVKIGIGEGNCREYDINY